MNHAAMRLRLMIVAGAVIISLSLLLVFLAPPAAGQTGGDTEQITGGNQTITGDWDFSGATCRHPQAATCPATDCDEAGEDGRGCYDTDATSGSRWLMCEFGSGWVTQGGGGNLVDDATPQLGGMLDVNGNAIGDGTLELLEFIEDVLAVNHICIENEATGGGGVISSCGDDVNSSLNLKGAGTGDVVITANALVVGTAQLSTAQLLIDSAAHALVTLDRSDTSKSAIMRLDTAGIVKWDVGLKDDGTDDWQIYNMGGAGKPVLAVDFDAADVNGVAVDPAATGSDPAFTARCDDTNCNLSLDGQGTGAVVILSDVFTLTPIAAAPAACSIGDFYVDTSGAACACSATNTWSNMHATGTCV